MSLILPKPWTDGAPLDRCPPPHWDIFRHCNQHSLPTLSYRGVCMFSFMDYINRPLSEQLWKCILERWGCRTLWVLKNEEETTVGHMLPHCTIYLEDRPGGDDYAVGHEVVKDIYLNL